MNHATLTPYLGFNGNCAEAMHFYQSVLGGELTVQTFAEAAVETPEGQGDRVMHSLLQSGHIRIMASDARPEAVVSPGSNVSLSLNGNDVAMLTKIFNALSKDGEIESPLEKQFWGDTFGMFSDKFGVHWMINIA
jgi:PhnB protein